MHLVKMRGLKDNPISLNLDDGVYTFACLALSSIALIIMLNGKAKKQSFAPRYESGFFP